MANLSKMVLLQKVQKRQHVSTVSMRRRCDSFASSLNLILMIGMSLNLSNCSPHKAQQAPCSMVRIELYGGVISFGKEAYDFRNKNVISQLSRLISGHNVRLAIIDKRPQPPEALEAVKIACKRTGSKLYLSTASGDIEGGVFQEIILE